MKVTMLHAKTLKRRMEIKCIYYNVATHLEKTYENDNVACKHIEQLTKCTLFVTVSEQALKQTNEN